MIYEQLHIYSFSFIDLIDTQVDRRCGKLASGFIRGDLNGSFRLFKGGRQVTVLLMTGGKQ